MKKLKLYHKNLYHSICLLISITTAIILWCIVSAMPDIGSVIVSPAKVFKALATNLQSGYLWIQISDSLIRVVGGFF